MSHQVSIGRVRLVRSLAVVAAACLLGAAAASAAILPVTPDCLSDAGGANDSPGETDLTQSCAVAADGAPYELDTVSSLDLARLDGAARINVCSLYNTDADAFADLAACTVVKRATGGNGNHLVLEDVQLYTCTDTAADRCSGPTLVPGPYSTRCTVSQDKADPFPGPAPGPGSHYPEDSLVRCEIDTSDFGASPIAALPLDTCSYSSGAPDSAPSDCIAYRVCVGAADCNDGSPCTKDSCDATGVCKYAPRAGVPCSDSVFCNGDEQCSAFGLCSAAEAARECVDGVHCTLDSCDEITDSCTYEPRNSLCSDNLFCTGVEVCDAVSGCQAGLPPNCGDGVSCTVDTCNESSDGCDHTAEDEACSVILSMLAEQPQ